MNRPGFNPCFVIVETGDGQRSRHAVRYFNPKGVQLDSAPANIAHNSTVKVAFDYFLDHQLQMIKTHAVVNGNRQPGISLEFRVGSIAVEVAKRLSHERRFMDGRQLFDAADIAAALH
jgi:hypothetical protein